MSTVKFLGGTLDENLTFNDHVKNVTLLKYLSICYCYEEITLPVITADVMVKLYYSLVYSHLPYALLACGRSGLTNAVKIECAHRRA